MKHLTYFFIYFNLFLASFPYSIVVESVIHPPQYDKEQSNETEYRIYSVSFNGEAENVLNLVYYSCGLSAGTDLTWVPVDYHRETNYSILTNEIISESKGFGRVRLNEIMNNQSAVCINEKLLGLENAYDPATDDEIEGGGLSRELVMATLSTSSHVIGGCILYTRYPYAFRIKRPTIAIWNMEGILIHQDQVEFTSHTQNLSYIPFEVFFSPSDTFFVQRSTSDYRVYQEGEEYKYLALPGAVLLHIPTLQKWEADRDVAFSSDDRYLVTVRGGKPTLVEARYNNNRLTYDMPVPMLAAVFSPDDQKVYIVGEDNLIYDFPSGIPSETAGWEVFE